MKKRLPLLEIEWQDAFSTDEWTDIADLEKEPHRCVSVGRLVGKTKDLILLAGTVSEDGQACCVIHIPRGWIKSVRKVAEGTWQRPDVQKAGGSCK